ncbi:MAG: hypothetical protein JXA57_19200 [Armatimonadetes bacterium]|nr:hypothetical protein [Armatimonadota bacterium]
MLKVKGVRRSRLLVAYTVAPPLYLTEERGQRLFEALVGEHSGLIATPPFIVEDQQVVFVRARSAGRALEPVCQLMNDSVQITLQNPAEDELAEFPSLVEDVYAQVRELYNVKRVCRAGRVDNKGYVLADEEADTRSIIRDSVTKLTPGEAVEVQLQFSQRDGDYNINLSLVPALTAGVKSAAQPPPHDVILTGSDVNNWDTEGDVSWDEVKKILERSARHADEEVPQFLREHLGIDAQS